MSAHIALKPDITPNSGQFRWNASFSHKSASISPALTRGRWSHRSSIKAATPPLMISPLSPEALKLQINNHKPILRERLVTPNRHPLPRYFTLKDRNATCQSTIAHELRTPTKTAQKMGIEGKVWHVKSPGKVSIVEQVKRLILGTFYLVMGKPHKSLYFWDIKKVAQREVLAGRIMQHALKNGPVFCDRQSSDIIANAMNFEYFQSVRSKNPKVLCQHIDHKHTGFKETIGHTFSGVHNPLTAYVFRRYFLGDEDCLKKSNYLIQQDNLTGNRHFLSIDFGMAFFNRSDNADNMNFNQFCDWATTVTYRKWAHSELFQPGENLMGLVNHLSATEKKQAVFMALCQMASF